MGAYYVGLDVHSRETMFVIQDEEGTIVGRGAVPTTPEGLARVCQDYHLPPGTAVGLETGTAAFYVARAVAALHLTPMVVDAHEVRRKAHRPTQKSDRRDAFEVCDGVRRGLYRSVGPHPESGDQYPAHGPVPAAALCAHPNRGSQRDQAPAARSGVARGDADEFAQCHELGPAPRRARARSRARGPCPLALRGVAAGGEQVRAVDHLLADLAPLREDMRRLEAVPGVGPVVALTALAVFADVHRFASAKHVASYAGLVPSTYQSGACDRHGHITKRGSAELRTMLCEAAHHARRPGHPLHPYFMKLCARRGYKIAIVAVAHRLCRLLYALLRDGTDFQPTRLGVEEAPSHRPSRAGFA
jgi:transposase